MRLQLPSFHTTDIISISEFTIEDFRSISFMIENDMDLDLHNFLCSKIIGDSVVDKFNALLNARMRFVSDTITLSNNTSNITINLKMWLNSFIKNIQSIRQDIIVDKFELTLDYPSKFRFDSDEELLIDCIKKIRVLDNEMILAQLEDSERKIIFGKLPTQVIKHVKRFVEDNDKHLILMESKLDLPEISVNFFKNSTYELIKLLYNHYTYDNILELLFMLSRRISDIQFLNSRNPRDLDLLVRLYAEEVEKTDTTTKSIV